MSYNIFLAAWENLIHFYKNLTTQDFIAIFLLHLFISWNGIQFILNPNHIYLILSSSSVEETASSILDSQTAFLPTFFYIVMSFIICYFMVKVFCDLTFEHTIREYHTTIKNRISTMIDFCVPAFFHNLGVIFILASVYLIFLIVYILLIVMNIEVTLDVYEVIKYTVWYFACGIVIFNVVLLDFILPYMSPQKSFSQILKSFLFFFTQNKMNICFFYSLKLCLIGFSLMLYVLFLVFVIRQPFLSLYESFSFTENLYNTSTIFVVLSISIILFSFFMQFFSLYCYQVKNILFADFDLDNAQPDEVAV